MPAEKKKAAQPSNAGIITDKSGDRFIPESQRADGTTRKAIRIRPGFRPDEDIELYRSRGTEAKNRPRVIPGAATAEEDTAASAASNKNAKRREARKKAKEAADGEDEAKPSSAAAAAPAAETEEVDPEVEKAKKARALKKKLRQAKELQNKKEGGESLLPEQIAKVIKINELIRELEALGFDADGEPKDKPAVSATNDSTKG